MKNFLIIVSILIVLGASIAFAAVGYELGKPNFDEAVSNTSNISDKKVIDDIAIDISFMRKNGEVYTITESINLERSSSGEKALVLGSMNTTYTDDFISSILPLLESFVGVSDITSFLNGNSNFMFASSVKDGFINVGTTVTEDKNYELSHENIIGGITTDDFDKLFSDTHIESLSEMTVPKVFTLPMSSWASKSADKASGNKNSDGGYDYSFEVNDYASFVENYIYTFLDTIFVDKENSGYSDIIEFYTRNKDFLFSHFIPSSTTFDASVKDEKITSIKTKGGFSIRFSDKDVIDLMGYFGINSSFAVDIMNILKLFTIGTPDGDNTVFEIIIDFQLDEKIFYDAINFNTDLPIFQQRDFRDVDVYGVVPVVTNAIGSYFNPESNAETEAFREKHGIIKSIAHAKTSQQELRDVTEANIEWVRIDTGFPFIIDANGNITDEQTARYKRFKENCLLFNAAGIKVIAVTPCPREYLKGNLKVTDPDYEQTVRDIALFFMNDLNGLVNCIQIANELDMIDIDVVVNTEEACRFIGINAETMSTVKEEYNIIIGYNSTLAGGYLQKGMLPYLDYLDYVGVDIYFGCFDSISKEMYLFEMITRFVWNLSKKPVIIMEFGYISAGKQKTEQERIEVLQTYGYNSEEEAKADIVNFVNKWPEHYRNFFVRNHPDESTWVAKIFEAPFFMTEIRNHFYRELGNYYLNGYDHTPEGQAKFYEDLLPDLMALKYLGGLSVYNYPDNDGCWKCGQEDCPIEGKWGIVDVEGNRKPAWYAIQEAFEEDE